MAVRRLLRSLPARWRWFAEPRLFWLTLLWIVLALVISFRFGASELLVRISGLWLQLFGLSMVAVELRKTRRLFGRPTVPQLLRDWWSRRPRSRRDARIVADSLKLQVTGEVGRLSAWSPVDPRVPITEQVLALKRNMDYLHHQQLQMQDHIDTGLRAQGDALHQEREARRLDDSQLRALLEEAQTGGLHISFAGFIGLVVGTLLVTLSNEISLWVR